MNDDATSIFDLGHYYSPMVDPRALRESGRVQQGRRRSLLGIKLDLENQLTEFSSLVPLFSSIDFPAERRDTHRYWTINDFFGIGDALVLCGMIQKYKPRRIVEVGSGFSSAVILDTLDRMTSGQTVESTFIEPDTCRLETLISAEDKSRVVIIKSEVQDVDLDIFTCLRSGDILFLDTSHVSKTGSDVNFEVFEILPRLKSGVIIHFHDILASFEYPDKWIFEDNRSWNEAYLIRAFLMNNENYNILLYNNHLAAAFHERLAELSPLFMSNPGGSLWIRKA